MSYNSDCKQELLELEEEREKVGKEFCRLIGHEGNIRKVYVGDRVYKDSVFGTSETYSYYDVHCDACGYFKSSGLYRGFFTRHRGNSSSMSILPNDTCYCYLSNMPGEGNIDPDKILEKAHEKLDSLSPGDSPDWEQPAREFIDLTNEIKRIENKPRLTVIITAILLSIIISIVLFLSYYSTKTYTVTVTEKEVKNYSESSTYLVFTRLENNETKVFCIEDSLIKERFYSSDLYGKIEVGKTYDIKVIGWRIPFLSSYENIIDFSIADTPDTPQC